MLAASLGIVTGSFSLARSGVMVRRQRQLPWRWRFCVGSIEEDELKRSVRAAVVCLPWLFGLAAGALADSWVCEHADLTRHVVVYYPDAPAPLPCEVYYSKPQENVVPRRLWGATHSDGYCERKAAEFVARLESWGWRCAVDEAETPKGAIADDTAAPPAE